MLRTEEKCDGCMFKDLILLSLMVSVCSLHSTFLTHWKPSIIFSVRYFSFKELIICMCFVIHLVTLCCSDYRVFLTLISNLFSSVSDVWLLWYDFFFNRKENQGQCTDLIIPVSLITPRRIHLLLLSSEEGSTQSWFIEHLVSLLV